MKDLRERVKDSFRYGAGAQVLTYGKIVAYGGLIVGGLICATAINAGIGAITGEVLDHVPYLNHAIPEGIAYIGNAFTDQNTVNETAQYLQGNLDKVCALIGVIRPFFTTTLSKKVI